MVALPFSYDFDDGTVGQALVDTATYAMQGTGSAVFTDQQVINGTRAARFEVNGTYRQLAVVSDVDVDALWISGAFTVPADVPGSNAYLGAIIGPGGGRIVDFRMNSGARTLTMRQNSVAAGGTSPALSPGEQVRWTLYGRPGNSDGAKLRIYRGTNLHGSTPDWETTGPIASTSTETACRTGRFGIVNAAVTGVWSLVIDRLRLATTEPAGSTTAPAAPALTGTAAAGQVDLSWVYSSTGSSAIASQDLERSLNASSGFADVATQPAAGATSYTDTAVVNGTAYFYRLRGTNTGGSTSPYSNVVGPLTPTAAGAQSVGPTGLVSSLNATASPEASSLVDVLADDDPATFVTLPRGGRVRVTLGAVTGAPFDTATRALQVRLELLDGHRGQLQAALYQGTEFLWAGDAIVDAAGGGVFVLRLPAAATSRVGSGSDLELELSQS